MRQTDRWVDSTTLRQLVEAQDAILGMFSWEESKEGYDYWAEVYQTLLDSETRLVAYYIKQWRDDHEVQRNNLRNREPRGRSGSGSRA